jgi:hypothetical protein
MHDPFQIYGKLLSLARKQLKPEDVNECGLIVYRVDLNYHQFPEVHNGVVYMLFIGSGKSVSLRPH